MSSGLTDSETDTSDTDQDENLGEKGINFDGFKAGLKLLNIDTILTKGQIELLFDHMTASSREYGIIAVDFCHFLKQNIITLEPKLADIQRKLLSTLAKQQDKEDMSPDKEEDDQIIKSDTIIIKNENNETEINNTDDDDRNRTSVIVHENINKSDNSDDTIEEHNEINNKQLNSLGSMPKMIIQISEPEPHINIDGGMSPKGHDIITPDTPKGHDNDNDDTDSDDDEEEETIDGNRYGRKQSVSISESMSVSVSQSMKIPSNIPRKSFKQINYNWNDSISKKSFNNYKKLREKFGLKYNQKRREKNKTKDAELMKVHEQIFSDKLDHLLQDMNDNKIDDNDKENKMNISNVLDENKFESVPVNRPQIITRKSSASSKKKMVSNLSNIDETKEHDDIPEMATEIAMGRSAVQSLQRVDEYKGNDEINNLRKLYKQQFKMKQKLERLRKRSLLSFPAPRKPKDITELIDDKTSYICKELQQCICKNTRYTGLANFGPNGELGIEIEFTSDCDENGYITGKRVIHFKGLKQAVGRGRIWIDLYWNGHKYVPCTKFEWIDEGEGVTTKFTFDSYKHEIDVDHSFFQGNCVRYPSDLDPRKRSTKLIMHEGFFDFVCVSARRRNIRRNSLLQYHTLDINEMDENELEKVPKYVRRMSAYTEKIDQLYEADAPFTKETLFGDAINTVAAISEQDPITSDASIPEQINE
eukprot:719471_1